VELVALKFGKRNRTNENDTSNVRKEASVLLSLAGNDWVPPVKFFFDDSNGFYLGTSLFTGGDLLSHLESVGKMDVNMTRNILAQLLGALRSLHEAGFVHRNIKPSNIVLESTGRLRLVGFSLCHPAGSLVDSSAGSVDYMAPEIISDTKPYSAAVDLWAAGIIMYEILFGGPPFSDEARDRNKTIYRIIHADKYLWFPASTPQSMAPAIDLIKSLLRPADSRITLEGARSHVFFEQVDWRNLEPCCIPHNFLSKINMLTDSKLLFRLHRDA
jgi:serine/threonine protein kinase